MAALLQLASEFHTRVNAVSGALGLQNSKLNGKVSSHSLPEKTSLNTLFSFQKLTKDSSCGEKSQIGTINGKLLLSLNAAYAPSVQPTSRKRKADTEREQAQRALAKVRKSEGGERVSEESFEAATDLVGKLLKLRGAGGETCIEAWAVTLRKPGQFGHQTSPDGRPSLVVSARIAGGVAIQLSLVLDAFKHCRDGMIYTGDSSVNEDFDLPMSEQCREAHERGQRSMLLLASVPHFLEEKVS